ncbi:MAG TPA: hypothetical protein DD434_14290, partial [Bacteroidales bacterium]|nr:hypothetical protein [Bacteroidales bacterium]
LQTPSNLKLNSNPVKDNIKFTLSNPKRENLSFQIINQMGEIVKEGKLSNHKTSTNQYQIPVQNYNQGIYFLKIENLVEKVVVVR